MLHRLIISVSQTLLIGIFAIAFENDAFAAESSVCKFLETTFRLNLEYVEVLNLAIKLNEKPRPKPPRSAVEEVSSEELGPGEVIYKNLNISGKGKFDSVTRACGPGNSFFVEGCFLTVKLAGGKIFEKGFGGANLVNYKGTFYVLSSWSGDPKTKKYIDRITPTGFQTCK